jgi:hypothetical protein
LAGKQLKSQMNAALEQWPTLAIREIRILRREFEIVLESWDSVDAKSTPSLGRDFQIVQFKIPFEYFDGWDFVVDLFDLMSRYAPQHIDLLQKPVEQVQVR